MSLTMYKILQATSGYWHCPWHAYNSNALQCTLCGAEQNLYHWQCFDCFTYEWPFQHAGQWQIRKHCRATPITIYIQISSTGCKSMNTLNTYPGSWNLSGFVIFHTNDSFRDSPEPHYPTAGTAGYAKQCQDRYSSHVPFAPQIWSSE
jgi:hypothetical protein